jgi:hypothetical protein
MQKFTKPLLSKALNAFLYNKKPAVNLDILKLKSSQVKSLELLQSHVGKRNLVLNNNHHFSRRYAENMYKNILYITFGGENAVSHPQNVKFLHAKPKIVKNDLPKEFKLPSKYRIGF